METRRIVKALALAGVFLLAAPNAFASSVSIDSAIANGAVVTVSGTLALDALVGAVSVGGFDTNLDPAEVATAAGTDLVDASIEQTGSGVRFRWHVAEMLAPVPHEGVRYTWSYRVGAATYQLQAKRTNAASITMVDDAAGHLERLPGDGFFQLRGNCVTAYMGAPVANCPHIAWLGGSFDQATKSVSIDVPFGLGGITAGGLLEENITAGSSIAASLQAVVSNSSVSDFINGWEYFFVGPAVQLVVGPSGMNPAALVYAASASISGASYSGTVGGAGGSNNTVYARACNGQTCVYASAPIA